MILAEADWERILAVRLRNGPLDARDIGPASGRASFVHALTCG